MRDKELILEVLGQIEDAAGRIVSRFESIHSISCKDKIPLLHETIRKMMEELE